MNPYAYQTAGYAVGALSSLARANFRLHGEENIPKGSLIFVINHFTRMETIFLPYFINRITGKTVWSLADYTLFKGGLGTLMENLGALSNKNPDRDKLIVKTLLTGEAAWIIFPEGRMVKNKKIYDADGKHEARFMILSEDGIHPPHTGAATLSLRTEFYRKRLFMMADKNVEEADRLKKLFEIEDLEPIMKTETFIVPVNITYNPMRGQKNSINRLARLLMGDVPDRIAEEIKMEGSMLLSGVDVDLRFGEPIRAGGYLRSKAVYADMGSPDRIDFDDPIPSRPMLKKTALRIMGRYMSAIYRMTTVNHDHILATLLKYHPNMAIDEDDLKKRTYLAVTSIDYHKTGIFRHSSFLQNQISLLTDDPHDRIKNFISLAKEKGVLEEKDGVLIKAFDFNEIPEFHQIRIENPIAVAAYEIEPLDDLQEQLKTIAAQPALRINYMIRSQLLKKTNMNFEKDYFKYAIQGESKEKEVGAPFLLTGKSPGKKRRSEEIGVLLVHGYMAAPLEVRALAAHLTSCGYKVYAPRLAGHGTSPENLADCTYQQWIDSVAEGYAIISNLCSNVVVGGFSFGAGLSLDLCTRVDGIRGVFAISAPLKLQDFSARFIPAVNLWNNLMKKINLSAARKQFVDNNPENPHINYLRNPLSGVLEMGRLMAALKPRLEKITIPALIIQSYADPVVNPDSAMRIFKSISSEDKQYLLVNTPRHGIINGEGSARVFASIEGFLNNIKAEVS